MATYVKKVTASEIIAKTEEEEKVATPGEGQAPATEKKRTKKRNNRNRGKSQGRVAAAEDGASAGEGRKSGADAGGDRRPATAAPKKGGDKGATKQVSREEKARQDLEKKRKEMSDQYEPFTSRKNFNSRFVEYKFAEWRKRRNNLFVTVATVVPPMPKKLLEEPDDSKYHLDVAGIDEQIELHQEEFKALVAEQAQMRAEMRQGQLGKNPIRDRLHELFSELKTYTDEKKEKLATIEGINKQIMQVNRELDKQRKNVHPIYNEESKLEKGKKELQHRLQTNSWSKHNEARLVKEISQVENSKPFFAKIEKLRAQISALKEEREGVKSSLAGPNKIIAQLKQRITDQKGEENKFDCSKKLQQYDLTNVSTRIEKCLEKTREFNKKKYDLKEAFYGSMCDYEIEQALIKDIEWIKKTKQMVIERAERAEKYKQEQKARAKERLRIAAEREQRQAEVRARQDERRQEQEAKRLEWEKSQLSRYDTNPYEEHIVLCEQLIYFCARQNRKAEQDGPDAEDDSSAAAATAETSRDKKVNDDVQKGKVQVVASKAERDSNNELGSLKQEKKKRQRKRDGPSNFYYEDENRVDLDYSTTQKFGMLELSPPTELEHIEGANTRLVSLREALKLKGQLEQAEGRAKLTRDNSHIKTEEYTAAKTKYDEVDDDTKKSVVKILGALQFRRAAAEADEEEKGERRGRGEGRGGARGGRDDGNTQNRRGRRDLDYDEGREDTRGQQRAKSARRPRGGENKPREKIAGNAESFPELDGDRKD